MIHCSISLSISLTFSHIYLWFRIFSLCLWRVVKNKSKTTATISKKHEWDKLLIHLDVNDIMTFLQ
jgi:hypothetical protein